MSVAAALLMGCRVVTVNGPLVGCCAVTVIVPVLSR